MGSRRCSGKERGEIGIQLKGDVKSSRIVYWFLMGHVGKYLCY